MVKSLEMRIQWTEEKIDDYDHEKQMDSLVLNGLKQKPGSDLKKEVYSLIKEKMRVSGVQENQIVSVFRFRFNNANEAYLCAYSLFISRLSNCFVSSC